MRHRLLIIEPAAPARIVDLDGTCDVGRQGDGIVLVDPAVSRRHATLDATGPWLTISDHGSAFGTYVNGVKVTATTPLSVGTTLRLGDTELQVLAATADLTAPRFDERDGDGVVVRCRPGAAAVAQLGPVLEQAVRARRSMRGIGTEPSRPRVEVRLVDHLPAPDGGFTRAGFAVDHVANVVHLVATAETPPAHLAAALGVLFATSPQPGAATDDRRRLLAEGFGLLLADVEPTSLQDDERATLDDPPVDLREAVAVSWARYLVGREGQAAVEQLLIGSGEFEAGFRSAFGRPFGRLEADWASQALRGADAQMSLSTFSRLSFSLLRRHRWRQLEVFGYMLFSLAFGAAYPFVSMALIDTAIPSGEWSQVLTLLLVLGGAFVVSVMAGIRQTYQSTHISGSVVAELRAEIHDRLQDLPASWFENRSQGEVMARMFNDVGAVQGSLTQAIGTGIFQSLSIVVSAVILMTLEWRLGLIVLAGAPLVALIYRSMSQGARKRSITVQEDSSSVFAVAAENYQAQTVVRVFDLGDRERSRFAQASARLFHSKLRMALHSELFGASVNVFVTVLRLVVMGLGAWLIFEGSFTVGGLVAVLGVVSDVLGPVTGLVGLGQSLQESSGALVRVQELRELRPERPGDPERRELAPFSERIEFHDVRFLYRGRHLALDGIDLTILAGQRVAFVGRSGSGKSTLLRLLMRLDEPSSGTITVDGVPLADTQLRSWRRQLGVVMQESFLFDVSLRENIALGAPGATEAMVRSAGAMAEVDEFVDRLPRGWDTTVGERGGALSGGQRQRVAIARALVRDPRILLLDEATSALDPHTERQIATTLERAGRNRTTIAVTHRLASVAEYDVIFVVDAGRIVERGSHAELVALGGVYSSLWQEQHAVASVDGFDAIAALTRVSIFANQPPAVLDRLADAFDYVTLEPGDRMAEGDRLVFLASGAADVEIPAGTGRLPTARLREGDAFGLVRALGAESNSELVALVPTTVAMLDGALWRRILGS